MKRCFHLEIGKIPVNCAIYCKMINKRAQRALGRSPEEKVKGHSGAIY